jgi:GTP-binding protein
MAKRRKLPFYAISAVSGQGVDALKYAIAAEVKRAREAERSDAGESASVATLL